MGRVMVSNNYDFNLLRGNVVVRNTFNKKRSKFRVAPERDHHDILIMILNMALTSY